MTDRQRSRPKARVELDQALEHPGGGVAPIAPAKRSRPPARQNASTRKAKGTGRAGPPPQQNSLPPKIPAYSLPGATASPVSACGLWRSAVNS